MKAPPVIIPNHLFNVQSLYGLATLSSDKSKHMVIFIVRSCRVSCLLSPRDFMYFRTTDTSQICLYLGSAGLFTNTPCIYLYQWVGSKCEIVNWLDNV